MSKKSKKKIKNKDDELNNYNFDPPLKKRYLPGEATNSFVVADYEKYTKHRLQLAQAKAVVDHKPPAFKIKTYYDKDKLEEDARLAMMTCNLNLDLARDINKRFRMEAKVDCWNTSQVVLCTDQSHKKAALRDIMKKNRDLYGCIHSLRSDYCPEIMAKEWKRLKSTIIHQSKYPWFKVEHKYPSITDLSTAKPEATGGRPKCYFDLELEPTKTYVGRLVFELYSEYAPRACANFEAFCKGYNGLSYKGTSFHRILSDYGCQGGDVTKSNGLGGASIYDDYGRDENCSLKHMCPGVLSSYNDADGPCDSKFNLSFRPLRSMDGKKLVFGKVIKGIPILCKIDAYGSKFGRPLQKVVIAKCGIWPPVKESGKPVIKPFPISLAARGLKSPTCSNRADRK